METINIFVCTLSFHLIYSGFASEIRNKIAVNIPKVCNESEVMLVSKEKGVLLFDTLECVESGGKNWSGFVYDSTTFKRISIEKITYKYQFPDYDSEDNLPPCGFGEWELLSGSGNNDRNLFMLLDNGNLMGRSTKCKCGGCQDWKRIKGNYFLDGLILRNSSNNGTVSYSGLEKHQGVLLCEEQEFNSSAYDPIVNKIYGVVLWLTALFYFVTVTIYGALWNSHTLPGRIIFSVILSRLIMTSLLALSYVGKLYNWEAQARQVCTMLAVVTHFFLVSSYSWVALLNYNFWNTFRHVRRISNYGINWKYTQYCCFGWGLPFLMISIAGIVDIIYKDEVDYNYSFIPRYGEDCFISGCAHGIFIHAYTAVFLVPAFVFSVLTFVSLYKFRTDRAELRSTRKNDSSSFLLYMKLLVVMSVSWAVGQMLWLFKGENDGSTSFNVQNAILLGLNWGVDLIGSSIFILVVFGCNKENLIKLSEKYATVKVIYRGLHKVKTRSCKVADTPTPKGQKSLNVIISNDKELKLNDSSVESTQQDTSA